MIIAILLTQLLVLGFAYVLKINALVRRVLMIFNLWWGILLIYSAIKPFGGYKISSDVYFLLLIFILIFNCVFLFSKPAKSGKIENEYTIEKINFFYLGNEFNINYSEDEYNVNYLENKIIKQYEKYILNNRKLTFVLYVVTAILVYYAARYSTIMTIDTFLNARNERFFVGGLFGSTLELLFYNYIISAFRYFFSFTIAFSILYGEIRTKSFFICALDLVLYAYIGSSRFPVVLFLVNLLTLWAIKSLSNGRKIDRHAIVRFLKIASVLFIGVFGMSYLTAFRRGALRFNLDAVVENFHILYEQMLEYSIGPLSGLSYLYDSHIMINHWFFGRAVVLNGIEEIVSYILGFLGIHFNYAKNILGAIANDTYRIGNSSMNALFTCIYWFFSDFGYIGIVLFSGLFAWVEKKGVSKFEQQPNIFTLMFAVHILYYMFLSNMIWQINNVDSILYILFIYFFHRRQKRKEQNRELICHL